MLEEIKNFILAYWQFLISVILLLATFIVALIKGLKKGLSISDIILGFVLDQVPMWINDAESTNLTGEEKRIQVLNKAIQFTSKQLGRKLSEQESSLIATHVSTKIEEILSTPQKKECRKNKSKYR